MNHRIRLATAFDSEDILLIYAPYITDTVVSFETEVPVLNDFSQRIDSISKQYPFLVYTIGNEIIGYAYATKHRERAAYMFDVDVSIYVLSEYQGLGIAHGLYKCLFILLNELGYKNAYASYTEPNEKSRRFHHKFGFTVIGTHHRTGYKFGRWHDVTWLEKAISEHDESPEKVKAISDIPSNYLENLFYSCSIE